MRSNTWFDIDSTQEASVREIANEEGFSLAKIQAQNVLRMVFRDTFPDYMDEEEYYNRLQVTHSSQSLNYIADTGELMIYPNPANDEITIKLKNTLVEPYKVALYDVTGRKQLETNCRINQTGKTIHFEKFDEGIYFVKVSDVKGKTYTSKLVISR